MTDTTNPNPAPTGTPVAPVTPASAPGADVVARLEGEAKVLAEKLAESNTRAGQFAQQIAALTGERDTFKATIAALEPKAAKADELAVKVTDLTNAKHEASLVDALRAKLPGADPLAIRGVLGEFEGVVMCDAYGAYGSLARSSEGRLRLAHCFAHARRKFFEIRTLYPEQARQAIDMIDALFLLERELPSADLDGEAKLLALELRRQRRDTESRVIVERLRLWAEQQKALPRSALAEAIGYLLGNWKGLTAFLDDPLIPLDNNRTERALRGMVLGRKNHYGSRSVRGTQVAAISYTLIETCVLCGVDPEAYLGFVARAALRQPGTAVLPHEFAREHRRAAVRADLHLVRRHRIRGRNIT